MGRVKHAGYDGIEYAIPAIATSSELDKVWDIAAKYGLSIIAQHYDTYQSHFNQHAADYSLWMDKLKGYPVLKINSQTGKDYFTFEQNSMLFSMAEKFAFASGITICHETHRNKFSFAAHITAEYLRRLPSLRLTLDASHWVCVAESLLEDQPDAINLAIERTDHIHARVGFQEGPQVSDPRAPQFRDALDAHLSWWDRVVELKRENNEVLTVSPEFGPYPYMSENPLTRVPLTDQWDINQWMMDLLKERYAEVEF